MKKQDTYAELKKTFTSYADMLAVEVLDNGEEMVSLKTRGFPINLYDKELPPSTGDDIFIREGVLDKLTLAQEFLDKASGDKLKLVVTYGYRSPQIQQEKFIEQLAREIQQNPGNAENTWVPNAHCFIAAPDVAGHPTGGAVDLWIEDEKGQPLDMGTEMHDLSEDSYVFTPFISSEARDNRALLREVMVKAKFAPFDGEWWHFSYGDREWAAVYNKSTTLYKQIEFDHETKTGKTYEAASHTALVKQAKRSLG